MQVCELRFGGVGGLGQDRGLCLFVSCTWSWSGCSAGWSCLAEACGVPEVCLAC